MDLLYKIFYLPTLCLTLNVPKDHNAVAASFLIIGWRSFSLKNFLQALLLIDANS